MKTTIRLQGHQLRDTTHSKTSRSADHQLTVRTLTRTLFPNLDGAVVAAGGHLLAGRIKRQTPNGGSVSCQGGLALPVVVLFLVDADVVVVAGRGQELCARRCISQRRQNQ